MVDLIINMSRVMSLHERIVRQTMTVTYLGRLDVECPFIRRQLY